MSEASLVGGDERSLDRIVVCGTGRRKVASIVPPTKDEVFE
ncbi:MAG TPA: hypothetical protein VM344_06875 [Vitreimonas sp.]|nr:hypothetical protein [Vitreimonas sp.]